MEKSKVLINFNNTIAINTFFQTNPPNKYVILFSSDDFQQLIMQRQNLNVFVCNTNKNNNNKYFHTQNNIVAKIKLT